MPWVDRNMRNTRLVLNYGWEIEFFWGGGFIVIYSNYLNGRVHRKYAISGQWSTISSHIPLRW